MKKNYLHLALLGIGAVIVLVYLMRKLSAAGQPAAPTEASNGSLVADTAVGAPQGYPNSAPIQLGNIEIGGSPIEINYNTPNPQQPSSIIAEPTSCDAQNAKLITTNRVPPAVAARAQENLVSYHKKGAVSLTTAPVIPVNTEGGALNI